MQILVLSYSSTPTLVLLFCRVIVLIFTVPLPNCNAKRDKMRGNLHTPKTHRSRTPCCSIVFLRKIDRMHHMVYNHPLNICLPLPYPGTCSHYLICALPSIRLQYKRSKRLNINNEELTFVLSNEGMIFNDMICSKHVGCELDFKIMKNQSKISFSP